MSVPDSVLIRNLIGEKNFANLPDKEKVFADVQSGYLLDTNAATGGVINFDTKILENSMIDYANAYLQAPLAIVSSTATAYTANTKIAFKGSALSLITALNTQIAEKTILNTTVGLMIVNYIRKLLEHNDDWQKSEGAQLHFAKDDNIRTNNNDTKRFIDTSGVWTQNVNYNSGFAERVARLVGNVNWEKNQFAGVAAASDTTLSTSTSPTLGCLNYHATADGTKPGFRTTVHIPLRHIHDFFDSLKFPIVNARMLLQFTLEFASNNLYKAFGVGFDGSSSWDAPTVSIQPNQTCRLYYRKVVLPPTVGSIVANMLKQGLTKKFTYLDADVFAKRLANSAQTIDDEISTSIRRPVRVFMLQYNAGAIRKCDDYQPSHAACDPSGNNSNDGYSSANILINNQNYYNQPLDNTFSQWSEFKNQMINQDDRSSLLKYSDYLGRHRNMLCFDLSHLKERMANPDQACAIQLNVVRNGTPYSSDFITVVEREVEFQITMSTGAVEVSSGVRL